MVWWCGGVVVVAVRWLWCSCPGCHLHPRTEVGNRITISLFGREHGGSGGGGSGGVVVW